MKVVTAQSGEIHLKELALPEVKRNFVLVKTDYSAISPGTELMMKARTNQHAKSVYLGYSATGIVMEVGENVPHLHAGERVACYGGPYVHHAEYLLVPKHLAVPVPTHVNPKEAATVGLGAIAIHALRQADLRFGEHAVIVGLGILGQIMAQIADAAALRVIAYDLLAERRQLLRQSGIEPAHSIQDVAGQIDKSTDGLGVDSVLLCAQGKGANLIDQGLTWIRDRGKVVIVGDLEMVFSRERMFKKEAKVLISRAGGPGRYDPIYERDGVPYPAGFVRWTEGTNMAAYIRLLAEGRLNVGSLITHTLPVQEASGAYEKFVELPEKTMGVLFEY